MENKTESNIIQLPIAFTKGEIFPYAHELEKCRHKDGGMLLYNNGFDLVFFMQRPTPEEVNDIEKVEPKIKLYEYKNSIFFLSHFGKCGTDSTFDARRLPEEQKTNLKALREGLDQDPKYGIGLTVYLICSETFILHGMRRLGLQRKFSDKFYELLMTQLDSDFDHEANVDFVYKTYSSTQLFKLALPLRGF